MIKTTSYYICDNCGQENEPSELYVVRIPATVYNSSKPAASGEGLPTAEYAKVSINPRCEKEEQHICYGCMTELDALLKSFKLKVIADTCLGKLEAAIVPQDNKNFYLGISQRAVSLK